MVKVYADGSAAADDDMMMSANRSADQCKANTVITELLADRLSNVNEDVVRNVVVD